MSKPLTITIPLKDFIQSHLGISLDESGNINDGQHIWSARPISKPIADLIFAVCENKHTCYIEYPSEFSMQRDPKLWAFNEWLQSNELEERRRKRAHEERVGRFLYEDNVETMTKACMKEFGFTYEQSKAMALRWVKQGNKGAMMICNVDKLKTKESEL